MDDKQRLHQLCLFIESQEIGQKSKHRRTVCDAAQIANFPTPSQRGERDLAWLAIPSVLYPISLNHAKKKQDSAEYDIAKFFALSQTDTGRNGS